jgi:capsular exopolysaccharide synthesis family protein
MKPTLRANDVTTRKARPAAQVPLPEQHLVSLVAPTSFEAEQYRILRHTVEQRHRDAGLRVLAVTSPSGSDGKTTTSINVAGALAQARDARVLLLEADLRRPSMLRQLGLDAAGPGLVEAVIDSGVALDDVVRSCPAYNLDVLPCGKPPLAPYEVLKSPRLLALLEQAREAYDYVIVDTPPVVPCPDYRLLEKAVDGTLLVVAADRTPRGLVDAALGLLDPARVLGLVFNGDESRARRYQDQYYAAPAEKRPPLPWRTPAHWFSRKR